MEKDKIQFPWEDCPQGFKGPVWRYSANPVIKRNPTEKLTRVFNSALIRLKDSYIGVFRGEDRTGVPHLYLGHSLNGIDISIEDEPIPFEDESGHKVTSYYAYDPRLVEIEGTYYIIWCDDFHGPSVAIGMTKDFKTFKKIDHPFLPYNRNGVLFPRKINGEYVMLSRPSDSGHTAFGDIFLSYSPDMKYWGKHQLLMERGYEWWNVTKIGAGVPPIETSKGWLLIFHGASLTCNGFVYSMGVALLDKEDPSKVIARAADYLLTPEESYETTGFVPNVIFPTSSLIDEKTGRIDIYYGAADTYTGLAFTTIDRLLDFVMVHKR